MMKLERELISMQPEDFARLVFIVVRTYDNKDKGKYAGKLMELALEDMEKTAEK